MSNKPNKTPSNWTAVIFLLGMVATIVFIALIPDDGNASGKFWFLAIALFFTILLSIALVSARLQKRMVQAMKAPNTEGPWMPDPPRQEKSTPPLYPFTYQLFDRETPIQLSPRAEAMLNWIKSLQEQNKPSLMQSAFVIWACNFPVAMAYFFAPDVLPGFALICCGSIPTLFVAWLVFNPKKTSIEMMVLVWGGLNAIGIGVIVIGMLMTIYNLIRDIVTGQGTFLQLLGLTAILAISAAALLVYALFNLYIGNRLKKQTTAVRPMRMLILWVFGPQKNLLKILGEIGRYWRYIGSVQFLQGGEYTLDMNQVVSHIGGNRNILTQTRKQLDAKLQSFKYSPSWNGFYPSHSLLCGDVVWKLAIDFFLRNADVVAMNLCGFSRSNQGCLYELGLLVDRFPFQRILFLVDQSTDMDFLIATLRQKWDTMPATSPNHILNAAPVRIYKLFSVEYAMNEALRAMGGAPGDPQSVKKLIQSPDSGFKAMSSIATSDDENMLKLFFETAASPLTGT